MNDANSPGHSLHTDRQCPAIEELLEPNINANPKMANAASTPAHSCTPIVNSVQLKLLTLTEMPSQNSCIKEGHSLQERNRKNKFINSFSF